MVKKLYYKNQYFLIIKNNKKLMSLVTFNSFREDFRYYKNFDLGNLEIHIGVRYQCLRPNLVKLYMIRVLKINVLSIKPIILQCIKD